MLQDREETKFLESGDVLSDLSPALRQNSLDFPHDIPYTWLLPQDLADHLGFHLEIDLGVAAELAHRAAEITDTVDHSNIHHAQIHIAPCQFPLYEPGLVSILYSHRTLLSERGAQINQVNKRCNSPRGAIRPPPKL